MAGRGPAPKPDAVRARRNRHTTASTLPSQAERRLQLRGVKLPRLPRRPDDREWDKRTVDWWREVMRSPMGAEYLDADLHQLAMVFELIDEFYDQLDTERGTKGRISRLAMLSTEIRQQVARFGIAPRDRLSLHWHVPKDEAPAAPEGSGTRSPTPIGDYRDALGGEEPS